MIKYNFFLTFLCLISPLIAQEYKSISTSHAPLLEVSHDQGTFHFQSKPKLDKKHTNSVSYAYRALEANKIKDRNTLSFEVLGDGSDFYASVFLGESKSLLTAHEAIFSLKSTTWQKVEIPLSDFIYNIKPWNAKKMDASSLNVSKEKTKFIGFGMGFMFHKYYHPNYSFKIRKVQFINKVSTDHLPIMAGLKGLKQKLNNGIDVNVLLLGDSITYHGKDKNHCFYAFEKLKSQYKSKINIVNAAIGGHTVRAGQIILPRTLRTMPNPDLVVLFYGANDCGVFKEADSGYSSEIFQQQLLSLIHKVNDNTNGTADFLLINGVARLEKGSLISRGIVEKLAPAYKNISKDLGLTLCDSLSSYAKLSNEDKKRYYKDTIHQTDEGLAYIGSLLVPVILKAESGTAHTHEDF